MAFDDKYISDLINIPNVFNIGQCNLYIDDLACLEEKAPFRYPDACHFLEKKHMQQNLNPDDVMIPEFWKLNLLTRVYVELKKFQDAKRVNDKAIEISAGCNIAALANSVVLLRCFGKMKEALDLVNELKEKQKSMTQQFKEQMIDAISEQAYYHYMFGSYNAYSGTVILEFVEHLRHNVLKDHEKYLLFRMYRRLADSRNKNKEKTVFSKIVHLLNDIENQTNDVLKALAYIEVERIMSDSFYEEQFKTNGEKRTKEQFIELAIDLGEQSALILYQTGLQKMKSKELGDAKSLLMRSYDIEPSERASHYLGHLFLQDALKLSITEENTFVQTQNELYQDETDVLRRYLLRYKDHLDWTKNSQVEENLLMAFKFFKKRNELLAKKTLKSLFYLALFYVKCTKYHEAVEVIDLQILSNTSLDKNAQIEIHVYVLKAIALEAQHAGPGISTASKDCLKVAVQKSYLKTEDRMSDDTLLNGIQKIPTFKAFRAPEISDKDIDENIRNVLRSLGENTISDKKREFKPEFLEITCIRTALFLIEEKKYSEALAECEKIISDKIPNNLFSKVRALILKAKALEMPLSNRVIKEESRESIEKALKLIDKNDEGHRATKWKLFKGLRHIYLNYSYFI